MPASAAADEPTPLPLSSPHRKPRRQTTLQPSAAQCRPAHAWRSAPRARLTETGGCLVHAHLRTTRHTSSSGWRIGGWACTLTELNRPGRPGQTGAEGAKPGRPEGSSWQRHTHAEDAVLQQRRRRKWQRVPRWARLHALHAPQRTTPLQGRPRGRARDASAAGGWWIWRRPAGGGGGRRVGRGWGVLLKEGRCGRARSRMGQ